MGDFKDWQSTPYKPAPAIKEVAEQESRRRSIGVMLFGVLLVVAAAAWAIWTVVNP